jgi:hypothetical protein
VGGHTTARVLAGAAHAITGPITVRVERGVIVAVAVAWFVIWRLLKLIRSVTDVVSWPRVQNSSMARSMASCSSKIRGLGRPPDLRGCVR